MPRRGRMQHAGRIGATRRLRPWLVLIAAGLLGTGFTAPANATTSDRATVPSGVVAFPSAVPSSPIQSDFEQDDYDGLDPEERASYVPPTLLGPATGTTGTMPAPEFTWTSPKPAWDALVLASYQQGEFRPWVAIGNDGAAWISEDDLASPQDLAGVLDDEDYAAPKGFATFRADASRGSVRLKDKLPPGRYAWFVVNGSAEYADEPVTSEVRELVSHGPQLTRLRVRTRPSKGDSPSWPGMTVFEVSVTPYATIRLELRRAGRRSVQKLAADGRGKAWPSVAWSCKKPGGRYRYRVVASDSHGRTRTKAGTFRPVSAARCRALRKKEQRAKAARKREVDRRVAERRRNEAAAQQRRINRFKSNCRKLGGTPELIRTGDGSYWVCVSPWGGTWDVPY
jgi:putative hemolysin